MTQPGMIEGLPGGHAPLMHVEDQRLLRLLRHNTDGLFDLLAGPRTHKLGIAFEALILWGLEQGLGYTCLGRDVQIQEGKRTMGALDLVVQAPDGAIEHWELAYKLFLQRDAHTDWSSWLGPGGRDRLDIKLRKMIDHQLPLSDTPQAIPVLKKLGVEHIDRHRMMLQGTLFRPWDSPPQRAVQGHEDAQGLWIRQSQIGPLTRAYPRATWVQCHKPFWFGPAAPTSDALSTTAFRQAVENGASPFPQLWSQHTHSNATDATLIFVVEETWGLR